MEKIRSVGDRVVVKPSAKEEVTRSGIVIPDTAKEKPQEGTIVAVGSGRLLANGDRVMLDVREGDRVLFAKYGGTVKSISFSKRTTFSPFLAKIERKRDSHGKTADLR